MKRNTGSDRAARQQRLPVNQRRHKVAPEHRVVAGVLTSPLCHRCNSCNVKRIKCSGERPCQQCRAASRECQYPAAVEKVTVPRCDLDELRIRCERLEQCLERLLPDAADRTKVLAGAASLGTTPDTDAESAPDGAQARDQDEESTPNEGRLLSDPDGTVRYLGSTSGATFLDRIKEFVVTIYPLAWPRLGNTEESTFLGSLGRYQTHDSRPLTTQLDSDPMWLPAKAEMADTMAQLRYFVQDGNGEFDSGGIFYWGVLDAACLDDVPLMDSLSAPRLRVVALFQAALALAGQIDTSAKSSTYSQVGEMHFARARSLLGNSLDTTAYAVYDIPILALMAFYLVEVNRRDAAYMYVSLGMRIAIMHGFGGVHRGWIPDEQNKRAFWTLYILDRWLSSLMGRPPNILDVAIRLPLPSKVPGMPSPIGLKAHVELSRISGYIVENVYGITPWDRQHLSTGSRIDEALSLLSNFLAKLPTELQLEDGQLSKDRACCELHIFYNQLVILTLRPIFFVAVKKAVAERYTRRNHKTHHSHAQRAHFDQCVTAARSNLRLGRWIRESTRSRKLLSNGLHNIFNAAIILLLHQLLFDRWERNDASGVRFAIECFDREALGQSNYPVDCARVLRDVNDLVQGMRDNNSDWGDKSSSTSFPQVQSGRYPAATTTTTTSGYDVGFIVNPDATTYLTPIQGLVPGENTALFHELSNWIKHDDLEFYDHQCL
ncbi:Uu.00g132540.m01.CDS01 [Anthostomella pinea]|uniref:Uu.00g132540.m01.CDS01 n=1 Tax=Anthostomella pinea TaxID=933095 RepID=A0AAI8VK21_9PEZI|nr:Uu.00g132540.m01.CDS01 [Anthostomella pinea]